MGFYIFMLALSLLTPGIMVGGGGVMAKRPPKEINAIVGYRTSMSMKNEDTWSFAHNVAGRFWLKWGKISLLASVVPMLLVIGRSEGVVGAVGAILALV